MSVIFKITRIGDGLQEYTETFSEEQLGLIFDSLESYGYADNGDDNPASQVQSKLYNLLEF